MCSRVAALFYPESAPNTVDRLVCDICAGPKLRRNPESRLPLSRKCLPGHKEFDEHAENYYGWRRISAADRARRDICCRGDELKVATCRLSGWAALAGLTLAIICGCGREVNLDRPSAKPAPNLPNWQVSQAAASQLAPEVPVFDYGIRPPQGYQPMMADQLKTLQPYGTDMNLWYNNASDGSNSFLSVIFMAGGVNKHSPEDYFKIEEYTHRDLNHYWQSKPERGIINGVIFARFYWTGIRQNDSDGSNEMMQGWCYASTGLTKVVLIDGETDMHCQGEPCGPRPWASTSLPLTEQSAMTFRKVR